MGRFILLMDKEKIDIQCLIHVPHHAGVKSIPIGPVFFLDIDFIGDIRPQRQVE